MLSPGAGAAIMSATKTSHVFNVLQGGRSVGTLDGMEVSFWCVDQQLDIPGGVVSFQASVAPISAASGSPLYDVRYEDATFVHAIGGDTADAVFRYKMAAWLTTLFDEALGGGHAKNKAIQRAIWKAMDTTHGGNQTGSFVTVYSGFDYYTEAINFVTNNAADILFSYFRVVSGYQLGANYYLADSNANKSVTGRQYQTFLTYSRSFGPEEVPEPGTLALMGAGLVAAALYRRRVR
jgi:hypothetical protein